MNESKGIAGVTRKTTGNEEGTEWWRVSLSAVVYYFHFVNQLIDESEQSVGAKTRTTCYFRHINLGRVKRVFLLVRPFLELQFV